MPAAQFSVKCYLTFSNIVGHGASLRFDPICSFFYLLSLYSLVSTSGAWVLSVLPAGTSFAFALLISLKEVFYLRTFIAVIAVRARFEQAKRWTRAGLQPVSFCRLFGCNGCIPDALPRSRSPGSPRLPAWL